MKNFKFYSFASALLLASAVGLGSCSSDSDVTGTTGNSEIGQTVKTQFAINIPYGSNGSSNARPSTRMTDGNTQATGNFNGIENLQLLTFDKTPTNTENATGSINIGSGENAYAKDTWRSVYRDITIPVGTTDFVLYGRAYRNASGTNAALGYLSMPSDYTTMKQLSQIKFNLAPIASNADFSNDEYAKAIIESLNKIANSSVEISTGDGNKTTTVTWKDIKSSSLGSESERNTLAARYDQFVSLKSGSAASVRALIRGLLNYFGDDYNAESKPLTAKIAMNCTEALTNLASESVPNNFPENLGLPDGVANISWQKDENTFAYASSDNTSLGGNNINYNKITYPAALAYYISSKAMTSDKELTATASLPEYNDWTTGTADWASKNFQEEAVKNSTRSVALKEALKYGVANLKLSIRCGNTTLDDNAKAYKYAKDQTIKVPGGGFPVSAILVGGQPGSVNWNFEAATNSDFGYTIYDTDMNKDQNSNFTAKYATDPERYNYTLVLDNNNCETKDKVYVTVELTNNAGDFYGKDGLIPQNGKFYLVGLLDLTKEGLDKKGLDRIFVKDYTTEANFNITSLKGAYNCIPDLRSSQIALGLAVDLKWKEGVKFDINIGDNNN